MNAYRLLVGKRSVGRPIRRWENDIKILEVEDKVVWIGLISLRIRTLVGSIKWW
jgi:hypothetical protein